MAFTSHSPTSHWVPGQRNCILEFMQDVLTKQGPSDALDGGFSADPSRRNRGRMPNRIHRRKGDHHAAGTQRGQSVTKAGFVETVM